MKNRTVLIGVTGGIAAYKVCELISKLKKFGYTVHVLMSQEAEQFITPLTLQTLSQNIVIRNAFQLDYPNEVHHIQLAKKADIFVIVPATANVIAKVANGIADDMLTTTFLASMCPKLIVPAMNTHMLENPITQDNLERCRKYGMHILESDEGYLACGDVGKGRLPKTEVIIDEIENMLEKDKFLCHRKILITAGPTQEALDPVRYITNHSSGKMGLSLAKAARDYGADVTLICGPTHLNQLRGIETYFVRSAKEMYETTIDLKDDMDIMIFAAAVADYRPKIQAKQKIHKSELDLTLSLERTQDILAYVSEHKKENQIIIGFTMETEDLIERAKIKMEHKHCDYMIANSLYETGAGFQIDTNHVYILSKNFQKDLGILSKKDTAKEILKYCLKEELK